MVKSVRKGETGESTLLKTRAWEVEKSPVDLDYRLVPNWLQVPDGWTLGQVGGVEANSQNQIFVYQRGQEAPPVLCFDNDGNFIFAWDHLEFGRPHMVLCDKEDNVWLIDDGGHIIYKLSKDGAVLFTLGIKGELGKDDIRFNQPTDLTFGPQGEMYVSDGYGNKRIAKFDARGTFIKQWGSEGTHPGQFALPHAIGSDKEGLIYVADRENWRVQIFNADGIFLKQWMHIGRPSDLMYVASEDAFYICDAPNHRITKVKTSGEIIGFFEALGEGIHAITVAPNGDIIVGLVSGGVSKYTKSI